MKGLIGRGLRWEAEREEAGAGPQVMERLRGEKLGIERPRGQRGEVETKEGMKRLRGEKLGIEAKRLERSREGSS